MAIEQYLISIGANKTLYTVEVLFSLFLTCNYLINHALLIRYLCEAL